jgi:hypothetical protein
MYVKTNIVGGSGGDKDANMNCVCELWFLVYT